MARTAKRRSWSAASVAILQLLLGQPAAGQEPADSPRPIPTPERAERAEELSRQLRSWRRCSNRCSTAINCALTEAGIEIPFPQRDLHLRSVDTSAARRLAGEEDGT
jgi:hypothetical protein